MIVGLLLKYWRYILDALLVIVLIVGLFLINPFGMFGDGMKLQNTANLVSDVRSIGQLVTAEYYGEVIASLNESQVNFIEEDDLSETAEELYIWLKQIIFEAYDEQMLSQYDEKDIFKNKRAVKKSMAKIVSSVISTYGSNDQTKINILDRNNVKRSRQKDSNLVSKINASRKDTADIVLLYLAQEVFKDKVKTKKYINNKNRSKLRNAQLSNLAHYVRKMYHQLSESEFQAFLTQGFESSRQFSEYYFEYKHAEIVKKKGRRQAKKQLAMIGRGSVKAGFDFSTLDENRFKYDEANATIHLFGVQAKILDSDINPWFIPERQIPGFDILTYNGQVTFEDAQVVKAYCKRKLEMYAKEADILKQANLFAVDGLKSFFSLMTGDEIKKVLFHSDELSYSIDDIAADRMVTKDELVLIDSILINYQKQKIDDEFLIQQRKALLDNFMTQLRDLPLQIKDSTFVPMSFYTRQLPDFLSDGVMDRREFEMLKSTRPNVIDSNKKFNLIARAKDQVWFLDSLTIIDDYNEMIASIEKIENIKYYEIDEERIIIPKNQNQFNAFISELTSESADLLNYSVTSDSIKMIIIKAQYTPDFDSLYFNLNTDKMLISKIERENIWPDDIDDEFKSQIDKQAKLDTTISIFLNATLNTAEQNAEIGTYQKWLLNVVRKQYDEKGSIVHASDWVKKNMINRDNLNSIKETLTFLRN